LLSIVVNDDFVQPALDAIIKAGATGRVGDGKIFVLPVEEAYRIRTGEKGSETLN
jgi:nitrogen regulatory protein P-II 1